MINAIKIVLAILFFICLTDMPFGFYQFVRFAGLIGFSILAYQAYQQNSPAILILYGSLALLYQPFFKIALGSQIWKIIDVVIAIGLIASILGKRKKNGN